MSKSTPILASLCLVALGLSGYEGYRARNVERQLGAARDASTKEEKKAAAVEAQIRALQLQLEILQARTDGLGRVVTGFGPGAGAGDQGARGEATSAEPAQPTTMPDGTPVPSSQVVAVRPLTPLSPEELGRRVGIALQRTPETLSPVTAQDLAGMPSSYEWGFGAERRMWRMTDSSTYEEVYPDGSYSVFPILGRAVVNDIPGVIATKDDGTLDVFIPDKGGRMVHLLRSAGLQASWGDYQVMQNVE